MKELGEVSVLTVDYQMETHHHKPLENIIFKGEVLCVWDWLQRIKRQLQKQLSLLVQSQCNWIGLASLKFDL